LRSPFLGVESDPDQIPHGRDAVDRPHDVRPRIVDVRAESQSPLVDAAIPNFVYMASATVFWFSFGISMTTTPPLKAGSSGVTKVAPASLSPYFKRLESSVIRASIR
jgi:hypothetical protein